MHALIQTKGTCWLYSNLNALLLSKYGRRVILKYMYDFYNGLSVQKKAEFVQGGLKCVRDPAVRKFYFYKFAYAFWFHQIQHAKGLSPNLHENIANFKEHPEFFKSGAYPAEQRENILYGLDIPFQSFLGSKVANSHIISKRNALNPRGYMIQRYASKEMGDYKLDNCVMIIAGHNGTRMLSHALAGIVTPDDKYIVVDSNGGKTFEEDWTTEEGLERILSHYRSQFYNEIHFSTIMYVNPSKLPHFNKHIFNHEKETNSKGREIHMGAKGGRFVMEGNRKIYIKTVSRKTVSPENPLVVVNSKGRKIHTGAKGGRFVMEGNRKIYIKTVPRKNASPASPRSVNSKGRKIHTGAKGGRFVMEGNRKIYIKKK